MGIIIRKTGFKYHVLKKAALLLIVLAPAIALSSKVQAQNDSQLVTDTAFIKTARVAIDSLYDLNYAASEKLLEPWQRRYPKSPVWEFWRGLEIWWKILPDLSYRGYDKEAYYYFSKADYICSKILSSDSNNLDALVIKAASNAFMARLHANREDWFKSFQYGSKAYDALEIIKKIDPTLPDVQFGLGIYNYYSYYIPEAYPFLKKFSWILPAGNREKGLRMLSIAADSSVFVQPEAIYFLAKIFVTGENNVPESMHYFRILINRYPNNTFYKRIMAEAYYRGEDYMGGLSFIRRQMREEEKRDDPYKKVFYEEMNTIKGLIFYQNHQPTSAITAFSKAQSFSKECPGGTKRDFYLMSGYYLGMIYKSLKEDGKAREYLSVVSKSSSDSKYVKLARKGLDSLDEK